MNVKWSVDKKALLLTLLLLILAACTAPSAPAAPEQLPDATDVPATATEAVPTADETPELRTIAIENVQVEIGVGSPIPVDVVASGTWPDLCAQVAQVAQRVAGSRIEIDVLAAPAQQDCPPDQLGLPFRIAVPLNMVELPAGTYSVAVNGVETAFAWDYMTASGGAPDSAEAGAKQPLSVLAATVQVGKGSPIPVEVVASGSWPELCAQLAEVRQQISGSRVEISLLAASTNPKCPPDMVGIPFRIAVPLNMVEMPLGVYSIVVNGVETSFEWTGTAPEDAQAADLVLAYIGHDGNLWLLDTQNSEPRQITMDAALESVDGSTVVNYYFPSISSDGRFVAARRDAGTPVEWGMQYQFGLWVYDNESGEAGLVMENEVPPAGFDWKPDTHILAYGVGTDPNYFAAGRGKPAAELATGIFGIDMDSGETSELVNPERGYTLMLPVWSPDGRFLSFDEILYMEGRGPFAYYDFEAGQYIGWDEPLGYYSFSPDSSQIAYDKLTYTATGEERIFVRDRLDGEETQISPDSLQGYAFHPVYSPSGERMAYLIGVGELEDQTHRLFVQDLPAGEPRELGVFESAWHLQWSPDGTQLVLSSGPYETQQVFAVNAADGTINVLAQGTQPTVAMS